MTTKKKRGYAYIRVSTGMQVEGFSLDNQRAEIERKSIGENIEIIEWFSDEGESGKSIDGRKEFQRMISQIESGANVDYVLVYKLSRFGRNVADVVTSLEKIRLYGTELICVNDGIDSSQDAGKLMISVLAAVAEIERENILAQTMGGRRQKAREGKWNGGMAPYGYKIGTGANNGVLEIIPEAAEQVRMIYDLYLNKHMGLARIANYMTDRGYRKIEREYVNPNPNRKIPESREFTPAFVKGVLDNPTYMGKIPYERRQTVKVKGESNKYTKVKQAYGEFGLFDGLHEAIIDEETWHAVREIRKETGVANDRKHDLEHAHLLTGILKCPVCGANMYSNPNRKKKKDGSYYPTEYYYCCKHRKMVGDHRCDFKRQFKQSRIDMEAFDAIIDAWSNTDFINEVKDSMNAAIDTEKQKKELEGLRNSKKRVEITINKIAEQMDKLDSLDEMYDRKYSDLEKRQDAKYDELAKLNAQIGIMQAKVNKTMRANASYADAMSEVSRKTRSWNKLSDQEKKELFQKYFKRVEIFEDPKPDERIIKKIVFQFPVKFLAGARPDEDMVYDEKTGRWSVPEHDEIGDEIRWDKEGNVECVALLSKLDVDKHIDVEIKLDEIDLTSAESKATYAQIKEYILEKFDLKVSTLYIAQVKRKYGLEVREHYNISKNENLKVSQYSIEKEDVILDALKHFKML